MQLFEITPDEYERVVGNTVPVFLRKSFLELNSYKVDKVHYLLGKDTKNRFALCIGEKDREWRAPFSAPFANIVYLNKDITVEMIWDFIAGLNEYASEKNAESINFYLPADIYDLQSNARLENALLGNRYNLLYQDINYSFDLQSIIIDDYPLKINRMARKNLNISLKSDLQFVRCESLSEKAEAYEVIRINREHRGFPLRMTKDQLFETIEIVDHDFFLVKKENVSIAAAVVYHLTDEIAQVVYWGNIPDIEEYKPINFISYQLIKYYKELNFKILDIGISTDEGKPNYGLCTFKESIGCIPSSKKRFKLDFCMNN